MLRSSTTPYQGRCAVHGGRNSLGTVFRYNANIKELKELKYFTKLTRIADQAFQGSSLSYIDIPDFIKTLGNFSFQECKLTNVVLPASISSIGDSCFRDNASKKLLVSLTMYSTTPPTLVSTNAFLGQGNCKFYVPAESVSAYKSASNWSSFASRIYSIEN